MPTPRRSALIIRLTHTGQFANGRPNKGAVQVTDLDVGYENQLRKVPVYVPVGGTIDINASSRSMLSFEQGGIRKFTNAGILASQMFYVPESYPTAQLPPANQYPAGVHVWNETDKTAYWSDGTNWQTSVTTGVLGEIPIPNGPYPTVPVGTPMAVVGNVLVVADAAFPDKTPVVGFYTGPASNRLRNAGLFEGVPSVTWTAGAPLYLALGGGFTHVPPVGAGKVSQYLGKAISANSFFADIGTAITL